MVIFNQQAYSKKTGNRPVKGLSYKVSNRKGGRHITVTVFDNDVPFAAFFKDTSDYYGTVTASPCPETGKPFYMYSTTKQTEIRLGLDGKGRNAASLAKLVIDQVSKPLSTINEIEDAVNIALHGNTVETQWGKMLARAFVTKNTKALVEMLAHGKNWNDNSKAIFCQLLGEKTVLTKTGILKLIARHCHTTVECIDAELTREYCLERLNEAKDELNQTFANGDEIANWVDELVSGGHNSVEVHNRKTYLYNNITNRGYPLPRTLIRKYAEVACRLDAANAVLDKARATQAA